MKYLVTLAFPDQDTRDRFLRVLSSLIGGLPGLRSVACSLRRLAETAKIETREEE